MGHRVPGGEMWPRRETIRETEREKSADRRSWRKREAHLEGPHGEVEAGYRPRGGGLAHKLLLGSLCQVRDWSIQTEKSRVHAPWG